MGTDVFYSQELLGHKDIETPLIYTRVTTQSPGSIRSPLDNLKLPGRDAKRGNGDTEV
jgi:hypothetical protein